MILPWLWKKNQQQKVNSCVGHLLVGPSILILRITSSFQLKKKLKLYLVGCSWIFFIPQSGALGRSQLAMIGVDWGRSNGSEKWKEFWWIINRSFADTGFSIVLLRSRRLSIKKHNILKTCSRDAPLAGTASQQVRSQQHARDVPRTFITRKPDKMKDMKDYESKIRQTWENTID